MLRKAFQITLISGLALLGLATFLPAVAVGGVSQGIYGAAISNDWLGGAVLYLLGLPFVAVLSLSDNRKLSLVGLCLGIGVAAINFYAFAVAANGIRGIDGATLNVGPIFGLIGAIAILAIILVKIFTDMFGVKTAEPVQPRDISVWKDLLDKEVITKEEFEQKKNEILKLNVKKEIHSPEPPPKVE